MHSRLVSWSRYMLLAGIVLALVLVVPTAWFPFQLSKMAVFAVLLAAAALCFVIGGGARDLVRSHGFYLALLIGALPLVYGLSYLFSTDRSVGLLGYSVETDTVLFTVLAAAAYLLSFTLFRTLRTARLLSLVVFWALVAAAVFQCVSIIFGASVIPLEAFADRSVNLVGKWNDLGLLCALLLAIVLARIELTPVNNLWRIGGGIGAAALVLMLALVNFPLAWGMALAASITVGLLSLLRQRSDQREAQAPLGMRAPWFAFAGVVLAALFLLYGSAINAALTRVFPVSSLEVRPGLASTLAIAAQARGESLSRLVIGSGPNTFGQAWLKHKPLEVNQTPFWNLDFSVGYSTLATAFGTAGIAGALAWLVPLVLLLVAIVRAARLGVLSREERSAALILGISSLFLIATLALYVPSQNIVLLAFVLSGATFGFLWRQGRPSGELAPSWHETAALSAAAAVLVLVTVATGALVARRLAAQAYTGAGLYELAQGNHEAAATKAVRALSIEQSPDAMRLAVEAGAQRLVAIAQDQTLSQTQAQQAFTAQVQSLIPAAQVSLMRMPGDYRPYLQLARIYDFLATLKIEGAYQSAQAAYEGARERNPKSPAIPLLVARLEAGGGNAERTEAAVAESLKLKPDYTDAILFMVQLNIANNDLASAIRNTRAAVQSAPGVASIWFQLGLLYYAGGDHANAIPALEQALTLVPEYANAKYFLGLSYYATGRQNDSLRLFEELAVSNPESTEVAAIVENLRAGKQPLEGLNTAPEERPTAPIEQ